MDFFCALAAGHCRLHQRPSESADFLLGFCCQSLLDPNWGHPDYRGTPRLTRSRRQNRAIALLMIIVVRPRLTRSRRQNRAIALLMIIVVRPRLTRSRRRGAFWRR